MTPIIRAAEPADAESIAAIHASCFESAWDAHAFRALLDRSGALAFVGKDAAATDLQAFVLVQLAADEAEIISLGTHPSARRSGLASALLACAIAEAAAHGARAMFLEVAEDNEGARALYERSGFALQGRRKAYYEHQGRPTDALVLRRSLP